MREHPDLETIAARVLKDCTQLIVVRDFIVDWILLESETDDREEFTDSLMEVLERLYVLKTRPADLTTWNDAWFDAHRVFVYETFLYIVAALLRTKSYEQLHSVFTSHYLNSSANAESSGFVRFDAFYGYSKLLNSVLAPKDQRLYSPAAELIKRQATRADISFTDVMQAEVLVLLMALINPDCRWYPQTLHYAEYSRAFPFFLRATQHKGFQKLSIITGILDPEKLRQLIKDGYIRVGVSQWSDFHFSGDFSAMMNLSNLDTVK